MKIRPALLATVLTGAATLACAHDTWFEQRPAAAGELLLALGTGNQFPVQESGIDAQYLVSQGCRSAGTAVAMQPLRNEPASLLLQGSAKAATCWAQLTPFSVELAADKIELYLREIGAGPELRATWAGMQRRGVAWKEHYTKHARIALAGGAAEPVPMGMDVLMETAQKTAQDTAQPAAHSGQPLSFQVLRDGQPLAGLPVELRSEASRFGVWRRTGADGRVSLPSLPAGRWVLRGTDLRLSGTEADTWESRFVTLAFEVLPAQNGSSLTSSARSANQAAASAAISSEPASSTTRR